MATERQPCGPHVGTILEATEGNFAEKGRLIQWEGLEKINSSCWFTKIHVHGNRGKEWAGSEQINDPHDFGAWRCMKVKGREMAKARWQCDMVVQQASPIPVAHRWHWLGTHMAYRWTNKCQWRGQQVAEWWGLIWGGAQWTPSSNQRLPRGRASGHKKGQKIKIKIRLMI